MADEKPPRFDADERTILCALLQYQRESLVRKVDGRATGDDVPTNLRWVLAHLLEETARHVGHADILRELIDGTTGR